MIWLKYLYMNCCQDLRAKCDLWGDYMTPLWRKNNSFILFSLLAFSMTKYLISELKVTRYVSGTLTHHGATDSTGAHTAPMERGLSSQRSSESRNNFGQFRDHVSLNRSFPGDKKQFECQTLPREVNAGPMYVFDHVSFLALALIWCLHFLLHAL